MICMNKVNCKLSVVIHLLPIPEKHHSVTASLILEVTYGKVITDPHDILIQRAEEVIENVALASIPGKFWVDFAPIRKPV